MSENHTSFSARLLSQRVEGTLRKQHFLDQGEHLLECKEGWLQRWRFNGVDHPGPKSRKAVRIPVLGGLSAFGYSPRYVFLAVASQVRVKLIVTSPGVVARIWPVAPDALGMIYLLFDQEAPAGLAAVRWRSAELEGPEALIALGDGIRSLGQDIRAKYSSEWQDRIDERLADAAESGLLDAEAAVLEGR